MTLPNWISRITERRHDLRVRKVAASRAIFVDDRSPAEIELRLTLDDGLGDFTIRMTPAQGRDAINQLTTAYLAINPPLTNGQHAAQWRGM